MIKEKVTIQEVVDFLDELLKVDQAAITALFSMRTACNKKLAEHETVQVGGQGNYYQVGMIGVFNGLFGIDEHGWGHIAANYDNGVITCFELLTPERVASFVSNKGGDE